MASLEDKFAADLEMKLLQLSRGIDPSTGQLTVPYDVRFKALEQYEKLCRRKEDLRIAALKAESEAAQAQATAVRAEAEAEKVRSTISQEDRRIDLEAERVQVQKAELVVRALEIAVQAGVDGKGLIDAVQAIGVRLLDTKLPLSLEDKEKK